MDTNANLLPEKSTSQSLEGQIKTAENQLQQIQRNFQTTIRTLSFLNQEQELRKQKLLKEYENLRIETLAQKTIVQDLINQINFYSQSTSTTKKKNLPRTFYGFRPTQKPTHLSRKKTSLQISQRSFRMSTGSIKKYRNSSDKDESPLGNVLFEYFGSRDLMRQQRNTFSIKMDEGEYER